MVLHVATDLEVGLESLGDGDAHEGQARLAALLYGALSDTPYAYLPAFGSIDAVLGGDLRDLVQAGERDGALLIWATIEGALAGAFWGYPLGGASEALREGLRDQTARALDAPQTRMGGLAIKQEALASTHDVAGLLRRLERPLPPLFYADWIVVAPQHRRSGLARLLWTWGLSEALKHSQLDGYIARTVGAHVELLERLYCRDVGGRAYFAWRDGGVSRVAFGGTDRGPIDEALLRACRRVQPLWLRRHDSTGWLPPGEYKVRPVPTPASGETPR